MWALIRHPETLPRLQADPELIKTFVEEVLRWESPVVFLFRSAKRDVELSGTTIPEGSSVMVDFGPANRDPDRFSCPRDFNLDRGDLQGHVAFGGGAHFCPGAMLARREMVSAFTEIAHRLTDIELTKPLPAPCTISATRFFPCTTSTFASASAPPPEGTYPRSVRQRACLREVRSTGLP